MARHFLALFLALFALLAVAIAKEETHHHAEHKHAQHKKPAAPKRPAAKKQTIQKTPKVAPATAHAPPPAHAPAPAPAPAHAPAPAPAPIPNDNGLYHVSFSAQQYPTADIFCHDWRGMAVSVAGSQCHHHEVKCIVTSPTTATVYAHAVPFKGNFSYCNPSLGPASGPVENIIWSVAPALNVKILGPAKRSLPAVAKDA